MGWTEDHFPIQTRTFRELHEIKDKKTERNRHGFSKKIFEQFDWTGTLLAEAEKHAVEDILIEYHDIYNRHRMDSGMNTESSLKLTHRKTTKLCTLKTSQCQSTWN